MSTETDEPSTYVPVTPRSGQQDRTADGETPDPGPDARARVAGARELPTLPVLSAVTQRVQRLLSRRPSPGEGVRNLWRDGAPSPAEVVKEAGEGPVGADEWPRWRVVGWQLHLLLVALPVAVLVAALGIVAERPLRFWVAVVLAVALVLTWGVGASDAPAAVEVTR